MLSTEKFFCTCSASFVLFFAWGVCSVLQRLLVELSNLKCLQPYFFVLQIATWVPSTCLKGHGWTRSGGANRGVRCKRSILGVTMSPTTHGQAIGCSWKIAIHNFKCYQISFKIWSNIYLDVSIQWWVIHWISNNLCLLAWWKQMV